MKRIIVFFLIGLVLSISYAFSPPLTNGSYELTQKEKSLISDLLTLSLIINNHKLSQETVKKFNIQDSEIIANINRIADSLKSTDEKKRIIYLVNKIKEDSEDKYFTDYIESISNYILKKGDMDTVLEKWSLVNTDKIGFILYKSIPKADYKAIVYIKNTDENKKFSELLSFYQKFLLNISVSKDKLEKFPILKKVIFIKIIFSEEKFDNIFIYPELENSLDFSKRALFVSGKNKNIKPETIKSYFKNIKKIDNNMILKFKIFHLIFHSIGPFFIEKDKNILSVKDSLKEYFTIIEKMKSELMSYSYIDFLLKEGEIKFKGEKEFNFISYLLNEGLEEGSSQNTASLIINYLLEKEGLSKENGKIIINRQKFTPAVQMLLNNIFEIENNGDYEKASEFINNYKKLKDKDSEDDRNRSKD